MDFKTVFADYAKGVISRHVAFNVISVKQNFIEEPHCSFKRL